MDKKAITNAVLVLVIIFAVVFTVFRMANRGPKRPGPPPPRPASAVWFYDLKTQELFKGMSNQVPPIDAPSGPGNGVLARVFVDPENPGEPKVGYLIRYTAEAKADMEKVAQARIDGKLDKAMSELMVKSDEGKQYSLPSPIKWVNYGTIEARDVAMEGKRVNGKIGREDFPQ